MRISSALTVHDAKVSRKSHLDSSGCGGAVLAFSHHMLREGAAAPAFVVHT